MNGSVLWGKHSLVELGVVELYVSSVGVEIVEAIRKWKGTGVEMVVMRRFELETPPYELDLTARKTV